MKTWTQEVGLDLRVSQYEFERNKIKWNEWESKKKRKETTIKPPNKKCGIDWMKKNGETKVKSEKKKRTVSFQSKSLKENDLRDRLTKNSDSLPFI
jgi:hypothetical protein